MWAPIAFRVGNESSHFVVVYLIFHLVISARSQQAKPHGSHISNEASDFLE